MLYRRFTAIKLIAFTMAIALSSCDKPKKLDAERALLTAERELILKEIEAYDNKTKAMGNLVVYGGTNSSDRNADAILKQAEATERAAQQKLSKWSALEAQLKSLREKTAEYKAKNLH